VVTGDEDAAVVAAGLADATVVAITGAAELTLEATAVVTATGAAVVMKTPPGTEVLTAAAEVATADVLIAEIAPAADWQLPVGAARAEEVASPSCSTELPGLGNSRSVESLVMQPLPMLAVNISGRALYALISRSISWVALRGSRSKVSSSLNSRLDPEPVMVIGAQFMYISRLPILLNQVQARTAEPVGRVVGTVKL
jgi:hypothetical protein